MYKNNEDQAERRLRKVNAIKAMFYQLTQHGGMPNMEAYEQVGYHFYISATEVRHIIAGRR